MILLGAMLAKGRPTFRLVKDWRYGVGYYPRFDVAITHTSLEFLEIIERELMQQSINCSIRPSRNSGSHILTIRASRDIDTLLSWIKQSPGSDIWFKVGKWKTFDEAYEMYQNDEHKTQEGIDKMLRLKGRLRGGIENE